ncbi:MAG: hypothetical protein ACYC99_03750 [Candidatus Geothermincolia bacterium]
MPIRIAVQRATWDVMHHKLVTPEFISMLERCCPGTRIKAVSDEDIIDRALDWFDAVFFPGSVGSVMAVEKYGEGYRATVRDFVRRGGCYIGVCGGCYVAVRNFPMRQATRMGAAGALRNPGMLRTAMSDMSDLDPAIGRKTGRAAGPKMAGALVRGRLKTFDLIDATVSTPLFFGDPYFIKSRFSKMVTEGNMLKVRAKMTDADHPIVAGHEGETFTSAYSGGPIIESLGHTALGLAKYDSCDIIPEAEGKFAIAYARHGDGSVIVSGPDYFLPLMSAPGICVREGMEPSVPWLTERILSAHVNCRRAG